MTGEVDTVELPTEPLVDYLVALAREIGTYEDHVSPPERGVESDVEWSWDDVSWTVVSHPEKNELLLHGATVGTYQVQTRSATYNPPGAAHPVEYEWRTCPVAVDITYEIGEGSDLDIGDPHIEAHVA